MSELAKDYRLHAKGLEIDGKEFPWWVAIEGPKVEAIDAYHHLLWVPVMVMKPAPEFWDGRGVAVEAAENVASDSNRRSVALGDAGDVEGAQNGADASDESEADRG